MLLTGHASSTNRRSRLLPTGIFIAAEQGAIEQAMEQGLINLNGQYQSPDIPNLSSGSGGFAESLALLFERWTSPLKKISSGESGPTEVERLLSGKS